MQVFALNSHILVNKPYVSKQQQAQRVCVCYQFFNRTPDLSDSGTLNISSQSFFVFPFHLSTLMK